MGTLDCLLRKIRLAKARLIFLDKQTLVSISVMGRSDVFYISSINFPILLAKQLRKDIDLFTAFVMTYVQLLFCRTTNGRSFYIRILVNTGSYDY